MQRELTEHVTIKTRNRHTALFWLGVFALLLAVVWLLKSALLPFLLGAAIAYLLDPLMRRMVRWHIPRPAGAAIILLIFFAILGVALTLILPFAYKEIVDLFHAAPEYVTKLRAFVADHAGPLAQHLGLDANQIRETIKSHFEPAAAGTAGAAPAVGGVLSFGGGIAAGVLSGGARVAAVLATLVLMPVVAFYMMNEWPRIIAWIDGLIPRGQYATIQTLLGRVNVKLSAFIRGQLLIALSLAIFYAIALTIAGVPYGFLIGAGTGLLALVPYVSAPFGMASSSILAWLNGEPLSHYAILIGIFIAGNIFESYVLTPRLMGKAVGMDPLWVLFAILAGGSLFGLVGMLLAVPVAASLGVLCGFAIERYRSSSYYDTTGT